MAEVLQDIADALAARRGIQTGHGPRGRICPRTLTVRVPDSLGALIDQRAAAAGTTSAKVMLSMMMAGLEAEQQNNRKET